MSTTGFVWHERCMWHDPGSASGTYLVKGDLQPGLHMENAETKRKLKNLLDAYDVTPRLASLACVEATDEDLLRFHTPEYVAKVQQLSDQSGGDAGEHAPFGPGSVNIARLGVGGTTAAIRAVAAGEAASVIGVGGGPFLVGVLSDCFAPTRGPAVGLQYALAIAVAVTLWGLFHYFFLIKSYPQDRLVPENLQEEDSQ